MKKCVICDSELKGKQQRFCSGKCKAKSTLKLAEIYGVSDVSIKKWCKSYGIVSPTRGHWKKVGAAGGT